MADKSPAFQFYPKDYLADAKVRAMTYEERGMYWELICHCWNEGTIPSEETRLARLLGVSLRTFMKAWPQIAWCFCAVGDGTTALEHPRLTTERQKQTTFRNRQVAHGQRGAAQRWGKDKEVKGSPLQNDGEPTSTPMAEHSSPISYLHTPVREIPEGGAGGVPTPAPPPPILSRQNPRIMNPGAIVECWDWMFRDLLAMATPVWPDEHERRKQLGQWLGRVDEQLRASKVLPKEDGKTFWPRRFREEFGTDASSGDAAASGARVLEILQQREAKRAAMRTMP